MSEFDPYALSDDEKKLYDQAGSFCLTVPSGARRRGDSASWPELLSITDLAVEEPGVKEPEEAGDKTYLLKLVFKVAPDSAQDDEASPNINRALNVRLRFNLAAFRRGSGKGQAKMTDISFGCVRSLVRALGLPDEWGMNPRQLVEYKGDILGQKVWATVSQRPGRNEQIQDDVSRFIKEEVES